MYFTNEQQDTNCKHLIPILNFYVLASAIYILLITTSYRDLLTRRAPQLDLDVVGWKYAHLSVQLTLQPVLINPSQQQDRNARIEAQLVHALAFEAM